MKKYCRNNKSQTIKAVRKIFTHSKAKMSHTKCQLRKNNNYEVKQRYIPTFVHEQIFDEAPLRPCTSRCTPTFHSTVFDTEGYNIKTVHSKNINLPAQAPISKQKVIYTNVSQQRRVQDNFNHQKVFNASKDNWYDHTKEKILSSIPNGQNRGYSRERKYVDLSSDPVFIDFTYENNSTLLKVLDQSEPKYLKHRIEVAPVETSHKVSVGEEQQQIPVESQSQSKVLEEIQGHKLNQESEPKKKVAVKEKKNDYGQISSNNRNNSDLKNKGQGLKVSGKNTQVRPQTAEKVRLAQQKPKFTVVRKSRCCDHHS